MRNFINVDKKYQKELSVKFSPIVCDSFSPDKYGYKILSISVFDHWLNNREAIDLLNNITGDEDLRRRNLHHALNEKIFKNFKCITYRLGGRNSKKNPIFKKFANEQVAFKYLTPKANNLPLNSYFKLIMPDRGWLYYERSDYTNELFYKDSSDIKDITHLVESCGLYVIG